MAHTYVVLTATHIGDILTITGTVDGFPVTISPWFSAIASLPNTAAVQNFISPLMLAAAVANGSILPVAGTTVPSVTTAGTFTQ
jgi:hypothetical protein